jgi:hypothetical protein
LISITPLPVTILVHSTVSLWRMKFSSI